MIVIIWRLSDAYGEEDGKRYIFSSKEKIKYRKKRAEISLFVIIGLLILLRVCYFYRYTAKRFRV